MAECRIAVILPGRYKISGGMARTAVMLCNALLKTTPGLQVVLGAAVSWDDACPLVDPDLRDRLQVVDVQWNAVTGADGITWIRPQSYTGYDFMDCAAWILWHAHPDGALAPLKPYAVFCADLLARIAPRALDLTPNQDHPQWSGLLNCFLTYRGANLVFATTPRTLEDVVSYAGVPRSRTALAPQFAPSGAEQEEEGNNPSPFNEYFLWTSNDTAHKNHLRAFKVLDTYYSRYKKEAIPVVLTGGGTSFFSPNAPVSHHLYHNEVREYLKGRDHILDNVYFAETLKRSEYNAALKGAFFLWHNVIYDNGTAALFEAAEFGVPSLVSDYPQVRYFDEKYGTRATFFSPFDIEGGADALIAMTRAHKNNAVGPVSIDYEQENALFHDWARDLCRFLTRKVDQGDSEETLLGQAGVKHKEVNYLGESPSIVWGPMAQYAADFPWQDALVIVVVLRTSDSSKVEGLIDLLELSLRQEYVSFKALFLLPDDAEYRDALASQIKARALAFDFILAGSSHSTNDINRAISIAQLCLVDDAEFKWAGGRPSSCEFVPLAAGSEALLARLNDHYAIHQQRAVRNCSKPYAFPQVDSSSRQRISLVPPLCHPLSELDFQKGGFDIYLKSGFFGLEGSVRHVGPSASIVISSARLTERDGEQYIKKNAARPLVAKQYFYVDAECNFDFLENKVEQPRLVVQINGSKAGAIRLKRGRAVYSFRVHRRLLAYEGLNSIQINGNFSFKAGGPGSHDDRIISWTAHSCGLRTANPEASYSHSLSRRLARRWERERAQLGAAARALGRRLAR